VQACASIEKTRERAFCYLKTGSEDAIDPLFELGRTLSHKDPAYGIMTWQDFTYAANNAAVLAGKSHDTRLYANLESSHESYRLFAIQALGQEIFVLRLGVVNGKEADAALRAERLPKAHAACLAALGATGAKMVTAAADCLKEAHDPSDGPALIDAIVLHGDDVKLQLHLIEIAAGASGFPAASLAKLRPVLEKPMPAVWTHDDVTLRGTICGILAKEAPASEKWARDAAAVAVREIGAHDPMTRKACETLAAR